MARGHIFCVERDEEYALSACADDVNVFCGIEFDRVDDENDAAAVKDFVEYWQERGVSVESVGDEDDASPTYEIIFTEVAKRKYFAQALQALKKAVYEITLNEFALSDPVDLQNLIEDRNADMVLNDGCLSTLDYFVRAATTNVPYYLHTAFMIH